MRPKRRWGSSRSSCFPSSTSMLPSEALEQTQIADAVGELCDSAFAGLDAGPSMVECGKLSKMPDVTISIAGRAFVLKPSQYILKVC